MSGITVPIVIKTFCAPLENMRRTLPHVPDGHRTLVGTARYILKHDGVLKLFYSPYLVGYTLHQSVVYSAFSSMRRMTEAGNHLLPNAFCGAVGGFVGATVLFPINNAAQLERSNPSTTWFHLLRTTPFRHLYNSSFLFLIPAAVTSRSVQIGCYFSLVDHSSPPQIWRQIVSSSISMFLASSVSVPFDTLRVRRMYMKSYRDLSYVACVRKILREEGLRGLFRNGTMTSIRAALFLWPSLVLFDMLRTPDS